MDTYFESRKGNAVKGGGSSASHGTVGLYPNCPMATGLWETFKLAGTNIVADKL